MEIRPLTVCLAVCAALLAVCHGCSTGREFITTFLPNYQRSSGKQHTLHLALTAQDSDATITIKVSSLRFSRKLSLSAGQSQWVSLPCGSELQKQFVNENSAVQISSTAAISVVSFNRRFATGDGAVVSPTEELGTDYFVFTPSGGKSGMDKLVAIVNGKSQNRITILPGADVSLRGGNKWKRGKAMTIQLAPYASYLLRGRTTLTGTRIQSQKPVAVLAGHQCLSMVRFCEHVYEQLPPVHSLGKDYMVPKPAARRPKTRQKLAKAGDVILQKLIYKRPLVVKSNKKVMVLLLSDNRPHDPFLITLIPTCKLSTDWAVETVGGLLNTVSILSEKEGAASVKVCWSGRCISPRWSSLLTDKHWVWSNVNVGHQQSHVRVEGDALMAVYAYGGKHRHSYGIAGVCSQATCRAVGDPHYRTFDGRRFNFQGTCTYIMTTVAEKASDLREFTVTTKNDHRGNRRVSFVRTVGVTVYEQTITIGRHRSQVEVNGELQYLPVSLLGGKVSVKQSGAYATLTTDFGLNVRYDWNMRLYITVPSSYHQHLGGLCGNYNGDMTDDLPEAKDSSVPTVLKMIRKWKAEDSDRFCDDNCAGRCPQCSEKQQAHYRLPGLCGVLTEANGPFSACHKQVDPSMYLDNCVYDVCVDKGARRVLCDNLKSYADACQSEGVKVNPEWRRVTKCYLSCPKGSHYEACGPSCPASCSDPHSEKQCKDPCVEGCQCDKGLVISGDRCVPQKTCGCQHKGSYYPPGKAFWADNTCTTKCDCIRGKAKCKSVTCKKNELCALKKGVRNCYPASFATCKGTGDPHYRSFDQRRFDFQGTCTYVLSQIIKGSDKDLERFQVLVQNENRGRNKAVAYTKSVSLTVFDDITVSMSRGNAGKILVNSQPVNLPYSMEDGKLSLYRQGYFGVVTTSFGLTLRFNWNSYVSLTLPSSYSSATGGLCGNYNGKPGDDLLKPDGTLANHINVFGHSWKAGGDAGCTSDCPNGKCPECEPALILRYQDKKYCGIIADKRGPFGQCHRKLDHTSFLKECVFDLCMYQGHASALCNSLSAFSTNCQEAGATVGSWRTKQFCPPSCGANSHYEQCGPPCPLTCSGLAPPEGCDRSAPCSEGCLCDDGFMLSDDKCVPLSECGCQYEGQYYLSGQVFYLGKACNTRCVCTDDGEVQCDPKSGCSANEKCVVKGGSSSCAPKGVGSCSVSGGRMVRSFDGQAYPLWGDCLFLLAQVGENEGGLEAFTVFVHQQTHEDGSVSRSVELQVYDMEITMKSGVIWEIKVDDIRVFLPVALADGKVRAHQNGINIIIESDFGLRLTYDTLAGVILQLPSTYHSAPKGLCGNYNGKLSDDPSSAGETSADTEESLVIEKDEEPCEPSCGATSCPEPDENKVPDAKKACDIIKSKKGPFSGCHSTVAPTPDYKACVREMSTDGAGQAVLCRHIQSYVTACQLAGAEIRTWRSDSFCPVSCAEGCQCADSLMSDGARCVPVEKCGCVVDGQYYRSGTSVLLEGCSERCACEGGQYSCKSTSCQQGQECRNKDGALGCFSTALCWASGDPHYSTFDNKRYSFQGTCTYVLVNTTGLDPSLPSFTVISKNELRGNSEGSFVRSATVEMLGHRISIPSSERGVILVDGIRTELPVRLEGGRISITASGIRGTLQSDFGVEVTFDWVTLLMVSISSSYFGNVAGLCGNYNGDPEDELTQAGGGLAANLTDWASTWSLEDYDPFCYHFCEDVCPQCSDQDRVKYTGPDYCGIISDKKGPFAGCHGSLPVAENVADCLYDVCTNEGRQEVLCEALSIYLAECQEAGASVQYNVCGSACPPSCGPQPEVCPKVCVEGCFCDPGYVHSGKECVIKEKGCGCNHDDRYYLPGETFWADSLCKQRCVCDAGTQKVKCKQAGCRKGEKCSVVDGVQGCVPVGFKTCSAHGDPHYTSFDGRRFDFQGNCVYKLAGVCGDQSGLEPFEVDGLQSSLPFSIPSNKTLVHVYPRYRQAVLETSFLKVSFDFASSLPNGKLAANGNTFGVSQWLEDAPGCSRDCSNCATPLPPDFKPPGYTSVCDVITAKEGPLADCGGRLDAEQYRQDCIYDMVLNDGNQEAACNIISDYVEKCQMRGGCVRAWRTGASAAPPSEGCVCNPGYLQSQDGCVPLAQCGCLSEQQYIVSGQKFYPKPDCMKLCECRGGMVSCEDKPCQKGKSCGVREGVRGCYDNLKTPGNKG
ncbi:IgGFc-binding protein [Dissostichus eleginoides]|uniref:IgGFc-binding protein n=1 Tax=Dissostichus eleginoides TaxID=100907 RepID=A0AAD9F7W9_DISEL|nr:IgGFc-binding protein [Dissostichus eleginoides]